MLRALLVGTTYIEPAHRGKLRALAARGVDVTVAVPQRWPEPLFGRLHETTWERQHGVELFPLPTHGREPATAQFGRRELASLLRDKRPDVVQLEEEPHATLAAQVARAAARARLPLIACTADNVGRGAGWLARRRRRRVLRLARGCLAANGVAAQRAISIHPGLATAVVPQLGVAVPATPAHDPHAGLALGFVGRLEHRRSLDTLLEALGRRRAADWSLTVVGDGPERVALEARASELRLAARIRWTGALPPDHLARLWPSLDVLVCPARRLRDWEEPRGEVAAEAMAHEVAVVATATGVYPEIVGAAGLVVPPDDPAALAAALERLAAPTEHRALAEAGRARALKLFADDAVAERTLQFWRTVLT
jgi:glycosyltransferase involved in cell wall biosynthesis